MIVGSLLLILGAVVTLALGLMKGSNAYLVVSIVASLLAAIALVVGSRQAAGAGTRTAPARGRGAAGTRRSTADRQPPREPMTEMIPPVRADVDEHAAQEEFTGRRTAVAVAEPAIPVQSGAPDGHVDQVDADDDDFDDEDPPDEPAIQQVAPADAARVARMGNDVLVVDGRPRYHVPGCVHLLGRESEPLPVHEAVELGFTPCGLCEPVSALVAEARRV